MRQCYIPPLFRKCCHLSSTCERQARRNTALITRLKYGDRVRRAHRSRNGSSRLVWQALHADGHLGCSTRDLSTFYVEIFDSSSSPVTNQIPVQKLTFRPILSVPPSDQDNFGIYNDSDREHWVLLAMRFGDTFEKRVTVLSCARDWKAIGHKFHTSINARVESRLVVGRALSKLGAFSLKKKGFKFLSHLFEAI